MFRWGGAWEMAERLSEPTVHDRLAAWLVGILVACCLTILGIWALLAGGIAAGLLLSGVGVLLHFRYFWSSYPSLQPYGEIGANLAAVFAIFGICYGFYNFVVHK